MSYRDPRIRTHLFRAELSLGEDGRTLTGYAVPFDVDAIVDDRDGTGPYVERFNRGAFRNVIKAPHVVKLCYEHNDNLDAWIGKTVALAEDARGLRGTWRFDATHMAERIAYKVRDGQLPALSVSFIPGQTNEGVRDGMRHRTRLNVKAIDHVAIVPAGAYPMLEPLAVRAAPAPRSTIDDWREWRASLTRPDTSVHRP